MARTKQRWPIALTIAGSDSGGGAGIQADLKTFAAHDVFGTSAITCLTAQNPRRVTAVQALPPAMVVAQIDAVFEAFPVGAVKTGMLFNTGIIRAVTSAVRRHRVRSLVVDPVMVATSGAQLLKPSAIRALSAELLPCATVITPNLAEAEMLWGRPIPSLAAMRCAAQTLADQYQTAVLIKGGHRRGARQMIDVLCDGTGLHEFTARRIARVGTHGTGCTLSSAIAANLARGLSLPVAVARAKRFLTRAIRFPLRVGRFDALGI